MAYSIANNHLLRKNFAKIKNIIDIPNLIDIQKNSYRRFLQQETPPESRKNSGLEAVFRSVFPIKDFSESASLEYVSYVLNKPKYDVEECHQRGMTFAAPMKVKVRLVIWDSGKESGVRAIKDIKEQEVYFGEIPLMTDNGTFIINGTERVIVSRCTALQAFFMITTKARPIPAARFCILPELSLTAVPGLTSSLITRIFYMSESTGVGRCRLRYCSRRLVIQPNNY